MTVRRPLTIVDGNNFRQMTDDNGSLTSEMGKIHQQIAYLYAQNQVETLSVVSNNGTLSPLMSDTRFRSGSAARNTSGNWPQVTAVPGVSDVGNLDQVTNYYDRISNSIIGSAALPTYSIKPLRVDGTGGVIEMTETDVIDTFIDPVVDKMEAETTDTRAAGQYFISTSTSLSNSTNLGTVYVDQKANQGAYSGSGIGVQGSFQDHTIDTNYQLFRNDGVDAAYPKPLVIDGTSGLREMSTSEFATYFTALIKACIFGVSGHTLRYNVDGSGTTRGSAMTNTGQTSSAFFNFVQETSAFGANDYRAQKFPNGAQSVITTYRLKLERT